MQGIWKTTSGGSGAGAAALAIGAAVAVVALAPVILAAVVAVVKALLIAAVVLVAIGAVAWWLRSRRPARELPVRRAIPQVQARVLPAQRQERAAIENHYHFYGMTAEDVAEALARRQEQS
jgi:lysylphosphatidylglycerol synthetase-like protein (DUF2156 family)